MPSRLCSPKKYRYTLYNFLNLGLLWNTVCQTVFAVNSKQLLMNLNAEITKFFNYFWKSKCLFAVEEEAQEVHSTNSPGVFSVAHTPKQQSATSVSTSSGDGGNTDFKTYSSVFGVESNFAKLPHNRNHQRQTSFHRKYIPEQVNPSPVNPSAQAQRYDPGVFTHWAFTLHWCVPLEHSSRSANQGQKITSVNTEDRILSCNCQAKKALNILSVDGIWLIH